MNKMWSFLCCLDRKNPHSISVIARTVPQRFSVRISVCSIKVTFMLATSSSTQSMTIKSKIWAFSLPCTYFVFLAVSASSFWTARAITLDKASQLLSLVNSLYALILHVLYCSQEYTILSSSDLSQNPERSGLGGASTWAPVLGVLHYALSAGISVTGNMVKMDVCIHNMFPRHSEIGQETRGCMGSVDIPPI